MVHYFFRRKAGRSVTRLMFTGNKAGKRYPLERAVSPDTYRI